MAETEQKELIFDSDDDNAGEENQTAKQPAADNK